MKFPDFSLTFPVEASKDYPKSKSGSALVALPVSEIIAIEILGGGCEPQSWGRGGRRGWGWYRSKEHWWVPIRPP